MTTPAIHQLIADFEFLEDWEDRYKYVIELGRGLEALPEADHISANKVNGCASQVWIISQKRDDGRLHFIGDSDAIIVRGLIAVVFALYNDQTPEFILGADAGPILDQLGFGSHLSPQRANGLRSMIARMKADAAAV